MQELLPFIGEYRPRAHSVPELKAVDEHSDPGGHGWHLEAPTKELYVFCGHGLHALSLLEAASSEYLPIPQGVHRDAPTSSENLPAVHGRQLDPSEEK